MNELDITDIEYETIYTNSFDFKTRNEKEKMRCHVACGRAGHKTVRPDGRNSKACGVVRF